MWDYITRCKMQCKPYIATKMGRGAHKKAVQMEGNCRGYVALRYKVGVVRPAGLEPATYGLEGRCTIRLCYERIGREYATAGRALATV